MGDSAAEKRRPCGFRQSLVDYENIKLTQRALKGQNIQTVEHIIPYVLQKKQRFQSYTSASHQLQVTS